MVDGTGFGGFYGGLALGFIVRDNCVGTGFRDTGVFVMEQVFHFLLWVTNRYGNIGQQN